MSGSPVSPLVLAIAVPAVASAVLLVARDVVTPRIASRVGIVASLASTALLVSAWAGRDGRAFAGEVDLSWSSTLDLRWHLGVDGVSYPLALLAAGLTVLVCWSLGDDAPEGENSPVALVSLVLLIEAAALGVFSALDLLLFFVFFELALIPMWFVIARWGDPHDEPGRRLAAGRFLVFTVLGSAVMLVGFVAVGLQAGTLQIPTLASLDTPLHGTVPTLAAVAIAAGLAVKTPIWPLHVWLPDAHSKAPTVGSVLLAGVFLKLGTYGLLRVLVSILPGPTADLAPWLGVLGVIGIVYACLACLRQRDLKRLIAYSSVGHMGFVVLAIATMSGIGVVAAVFGSVAHGVITGLLFFNAGSLKRRFGSSEFTTIGRGLYARLPVLATVLGFAAVASLGLPGLAGFWGEMLSLRSAYLVGPVLSEPLAWTLLGIAAVGVVLTSAYFVAMLRRMLHGVPTADSRDLDLDGSERWIAGVLVLATLTLGLAPGWLVGVIEPSVNAIVGGVR